MEFKFVSQIRKGNNRGAGFFYIPQNQLNLFILHEKIKVKLCNKINFFAQITKYDNRFGIYVPRCIMKQNDLLNKDVKVQLSRINGFYAPVASDGRIYIPYDIVRDKILRHNDIISIKAIENNKIVQEEYIKIYVTRRPKRKQEEFICYVNKNLSGKTLVFQAEKLSSVPRNEKMDPLVAKLLYGTHYTFVNKNLVIVFKGNKVPVIINPNLKLSNLAFYLGAYFADGTKIGNSWAICASTFEQANYYLKMHNFLIRDSNPEFTISYTNIDKTDTKEVKRNLAKIWENQTGIKVNKFRIRKPDGKVISKWNQYGTFIIREHRQILLDLYNVLVKLLIREILSKKNKKLAIDFICGVMEGDGYPAANPKGSISIWTNKNDLSVLEKILKITKIEFKVRKEGENKYALKIGVIEILRSFHLLKEKIFVFYPKRRMTLFERLKTVGATKFLIESHKATNWVKALLRDNGFCNKNYQLTNKGLKLRDELVANINKAIA